MVGITEAQAQPLFHLGSVGISLPYALQGQIVGFVIFMIAALAELIRIPFDMPVAESELVMGYLTEYSGIRFTMFLLAEYAGMFAMSAMASVLFLGGYHFWGLNADWFGPFVLLAKASVLCLRDDLVPLDLAALPRGPVAVAGLALAGAPGPGQHRGHRRSSRWFYEPPALAHRSRSARQFPGWACSRACG